MTHPQRTTERVQKKLALAKANILMSHELTAKTVQTINWTTEQPSETTRSLHMIFRCSTLTDLIHHLCLI